MQLVAGGMADADEVLRAAPRGSVPWLRGLSMYLAGTIMTGRIEDLTAAIALLREVEPEPDAEVRMALPFVVAIGVLDAFGRIPEGTRLEARFFAAVRPTPEREPLARFWWNVLLGMRASHAHEDPWRDLRKAARRLPR